MKIRFWDRVLAALAGLLVLLAGVGLLVYGIGLFPIKLDLSLLEGPFQVWQRVAMSAAALVLVALGLHGMSLLFHRHREKGFVIQQTEYGDMSISMNAMETMVKKCVAAHQELSVNATSISRGHEGILVDLKITLRSGVNIPLTVNALQKQIKEYIASCSGVEVQQVRVMVETDSTPAKLLPGDAETPVATEPAAQQPSAQPAAEPAQRQPEQAAEPAEETEPAAQPVENAWHEEEAGV